MLCVVMILCLALPAALTASELDKETKAMLDGVGGTDVYPDANALYVLSKTHTSYEKEGTAISKVHLLIKILTEKAIQQHGERHLAYYRVYDSIMIETARVIKPDGSVIDVAPEDIRDVSAAILEYMNIYDPDVREKVIAFKGLEIGDCIELKYTDNLFHPPMDNEFDGSDLFQYTDPIIRKVTTINGPADMPIRHVTRNGEVTFATETTGTRTTYRWEAENVPRIIPEPAMPSLMEVAPAVYFTTIEDWGAISRWWNDIAESKYEISDALHAEIESLTSGKNTETEKIDAIYHFVAQKVRYMGLGTGKKKGFEPKPVSETYETRYGVCRDVAALMVAMLRDAGIDADIVLTGAGYEMERELPTLSFNHAIVAVNNDDGSITYADPTIENSVDWLPAVEAEQQVLVCTSEGKTLKDTPYSPPEENMGHVRAVSTLSESGLYTSDVTLSTDGFYDMALRSFLKRLPAARQKMIFGMMLQDIYPGTVLEDFSTSDAEDLSAPVTINIRYSIPDYPANADNFRLFKSPVALGVFELISSSVFQAASLPERKYPFQLGFTFGATEEEIITLPLGYKVKSAPDPVEKSYGSIEYNMTYSSEPEVELLKTGTKQVTFKRQLLLKSKRMSPDEYAQFKDALKASAKAKRGEIILEAEKEG